MPLNLFVTSPRRLRQFTFLTCPLKNWGRLSNLHLIAIVDDSGLLSSDLTRVVTGNELEAASAALLEGMGGDLPDVLQLPMGLNPDFSFGASNDIARGVHIHRYAMVDPSLSQHFLAMKEKAAAFAESLGEGVSLVMVAAQVGRVVWEALIRSHVGVGIPLALEMARPSMELSA